MPTNLYGPNDNFDLEKSHVLPALIRKFHEAKENGDPSTEVWGIRKPQERISPCRRPGGCLYFPNGSPRRSL